MFFLRYIINYLRSITSILHKWDKCISYITFTNENIKIALLIKSNRRSEQYTIRIVHIRKTHNLICTDFKQYLITITS